MDSNYLEKRFSEQFGKINTLENVSQRREKAAQDAIKKLDSLRNYAERMAVYRQEQQDSFAGQWLQKVDEVAPWDVNTDPEGIPHRALNNAAGFASTVSNIAGNLASAPKSIEAFTNTIAVPEEAKTGRRVRTYQEANDLPEGITTQRERDALASRPAEHTGPTGLPEERLRQIGRQGRVGFAGQLAEALFGKDSSQASTADELLQRAEDARREGKEIREAFDISDAVDRTTQMEMAHQFTQAGADKHLDKLIKGWELVNAGDQDAGTALTAEALTELGKLAVTIAPSNPQALLLYLSESLPEMIPFILGGPFTAVGAGMAGLRAQANYEEGIQNYMDANDGQMPFPEETRDMAAWAAGGAAVGVAGDRLLGGAVGQAGRALAGSPRRAIDDAVDTLRQTFGSRVGRTARDTVGGIGGEAAAEGFETYAEGEATVKPASARDIYDASVIGGAIGGGLAGGSRATIEAAETVQDLNQRTIERLNRVREDSKEIFQKAVETNDVSTLLDSRSKHYDPVRAVDALKEIAKKEGVTPEQREGYKEQASNIIESLQNQRENFDQFLRLPEAIEKARQNVAQFQQRLDNLPADASQQVRDALQLNINMWQELASKQPLEGSALTRARKEADQLDKQIERATRSRDLILTDEVAEVSPEALQEAVTAANTNVANAPDESLQKAREGSRTVIQLAMSAPERLAGIDLAALISNIENVLTPGEREFLRTFSEARQASNATKSSSEVYRNIVEGEPASKDSPGFKGIADYRREIFNAISSGARTEAQSAMEAFRTFMTDQQNKAALAKQVYDSLQPGQQAYIERPENSTEWRAVFEAIPEEVRREQGALSIYKRVPRENGQGVYDSKRLVNEELPLGPRALEAFDAEAEAAFNLKFQESTGVVEPTSNVSETPETTEVNEVVEEVEVNEPTEVTEDIEEIEVTSLPPTPQEGETVAEPYVAGQITSDVTQNSDIPVSRQESVVERTNAVTEVGDSEATVDAPQTDSPLLAITSEAVDTGLPYRESNPLAGKLTQEASRKGESTKRPLVVIKDFIHNLQGFDLVETLGKKWEGRITQGHRDFLRYYINMAREWSREIPKILAPAEGKQRDYRYKDLVQFLIQTNEVDGKQVVDLEENLKAAITFSGLSWVSETLSRNLHNTDEDINRILGRDKNTKVEATEREAFAQGVPQHILQETLGRHVVQALGLRTKAGTVGNERVQPTQDLMPKLQSGLGAYVLEMLQKEGLVVEENVSYLDGNDQTVEGKLYRLNTSGENRDQLTPKLQEIKDASTKVYPVLNDLMGSELIKPMPTFDPVVYEQKTANRSLQLNTDQIVEAVNAKNAEPNVLNESMYRVTYKLSSEALQRIAGIEEVSTETHHIDDIKGAQARNDGLVRELESLFEFIAEGFGEQIDFDQQFFLQHEPWSNGRVGISSLINPQASKIHREFVSHPDWKVEIKSNSRKMMRAFWVRVGDGLGFASDKKIHRTAKAELDKFLKRPEIVQAIDALKELERNADNSEFVPTQAQEAAIVKAVEMGGEKFHSLQALTAVARYQIAEEASNGKPFSFSTELRADRDGVANGPMLSMLLLGGSTTAEGLSVLLKKGGFYTAADNISQFNEWLASNPLNRDLYQTSAGRIRDIAAQLYKTAKESGDTVLTRRFENLWKLGGKFVEDGQVTKDGRERLKALLNPLFFGSGLNKAINNMAESFLENYKKQIVAIYRDPNRAGELPSLVQAYNELLKDGDYRGSPIPQTITAKALMNRPISKSELLAFREAFKGTIGRAAEQMILEDFGPFLHSRDLMTSTSQMSFVIYDAAKKTLREQFIQEEVKHGRMEVDAAGNPIHDLTANQEARLNKELHRLIPFTHSYYSKDSGKVDQAVRLTNSSRKQTDDPAYVGETYLKRAGKRVRRMVRPYVNEETNPSVRILSALIHSLDSAISHMSQMAGIQAKNPRSLLNMHDSVGGSLASDTTDSQTINQMLLQTVTRYSPLQETLDMVLRNLGGLQILGEAETEQGTAIKKAVAKAIVDEVYAQRVRAVPESRANPVNEFDLENFFFGSIRDLDNKAYEADKTKLEALKQMAYIGQYAGEAGSYQLTEADQASIDEEIAALEEKLGRSEGVLDQVQTFLGEELAEAIRAFRTPDQAIVEQEQAQREMEGVVRYYASTRLPRPEQIQLLTYLASINEDLAPTARQVKQALLVSRKRSFQDAIKGMVPDVVRTLAREMDTLMQQIPEHYRNGLLRTGEKGNTHNPKLVAQFEANPEQTLENLKDLMREELKLMGKKNPAAKFYSALFEEAYRQAKGLKVVYVTPSTHPDMIMKDNDPSINDMAWYSLSSDGKEAVYIRSTAFKNSQVTTLTLLHELVHQNVAATVAAALNDINHPAHQYAKTLDELRTELAGKVKGKHEVPLSDLQEFIAYGLTDPSFQQEVLMRSRTDQPRNTRSISTYFKDFINSLANLFFKGRIRENSNTAMTVLITNFSGLMEVAQDRKAQDVAQIKQFIQQAISSKEPSLSAQDILSALDTGDHSSAFRQHLHQVQDNIVNALHGPLGAFKEQIKAAMPKDPLDAFIAATESGSTTFTDQATTAGISLSYQESFVMDQVYATVHAAITDGSATTKMVYRELDQLYEEAKRKLNPQDFHSGDWIAATPEQQAQAKRAYDFVFEMKRGSDGRFDYLSRFAAMGLAQESLNTALQRPTEVQAPVDSQTFLQRLQALFNRIASFFSDKVTKTYQGQQADEKLKTLVEQLVTGEVKRQNQLENHSSGMMERVDNALRKGIANTVDKTISKLADSMELRHSNNALVKAAAITAKVVSDEQVGNYLKAIQNIRDGFSKDRNGLVMGLVNYTGGIPDRLNALIHWAKNVQGLRQSVISQVSQNVLEFYDQELYDGQKKAITFAFLKTGAFTILDKHGLRTLEQLLGDFSMLTGQIKDQGKRIQAMQPQHATFLLNQAEALGHHLIHGGSYLEGGLLRNTHNMARLLGTKYQDTLSQQEMDALKPELDLLVSLYALSNVNVQDRKEAQQVLARENSRDDGGNGVEITLKYYQTQLEASRDRNFRGDPTLTTQYYLPKVYHPRTDVKVASGNEATKLEAQHYVKVAQLPQDPMDPNKEPRYLYVQKDGGLTARTSSALNYIDTHAAGSLLGESGDFLTNLKASTVQMRKQRDAAQLYSTRIHPPASPTSAALVPVFNPSGEVVNYAYHMISKTADEYLEPDYRFEYLMGRLEGAMIEKQLAPEVNLKVVEFLKEIYDEDYAIYPESFREISATSKNAEDRRLYNELPESTKQAVREVMGSDKLLVRNDLMDPVFGYSTYSILNAFRKDFSQRNWMEKVIVMASEWVLQTYGEMRGMSPKEAEHFSKSAGIKLRKGELATQEIVKAIKDTIVIKTINVALDNIISNQTVLWIEGVPLKRSIELQTQAYRSALKYQNDQKELHRLNMLINSGAFQGNDLNELVRASLKVEQEIELNPVKQMLDTGLLPSIVDDVSVVDDPYTYASTIEEKAQPYLDRLPDALKSKSLKWLGKQVFMTHDTALYKTMNQLTQMGDFTARYALYTHLTTRELNPLTHDEAVKRASESFINYDIPLPRSLAYMEGMGLTYFFKYFLGIQRVLARMMKERPASTMTMHLAGSFLDSIASVTDSAAVHRIGWNPLRWGVLEADTLLTEQAITGAAIKAFN